ncbi:polysaccharide biosynthesis/export family protein [Rapidithrix thailandica]|uniref:Polysaccharide biosynthesis/export family protein n=1 Tax=Rapidithrix thailandica TaxID=413964 RepID=A0AAW9SBW0_9BACT
MNRILLFILLVGVFAQCKTYNILETKRAERKQTEAELDSAFLYNPDYQYTIRKNDKISISVWGQDELSVGSVYGIYNSNEVYGKWLMVDVNGHIEVPKIGTMHVLGKTIPELKEILACVLQKWIVTPIVDVKVLNKEITLLGEVKDPGVIPIDKDHYTLLEIIARAGGFEFYANIRSVKILRQEGEHVRVAHVNLAKSGDFFKKNIQLYPGDFVIVPSKKNKDFDKRVSTIIPFTTTATAAAILMGVF